MVVKLTSPPRTWVSTRVETLWRARNGTSHQKRKLKISFSDKNLEILKILSFVEIFDSIFHHDDGRYEKKFRNLKNAEFYELSRALLRIWSKPR